MNFAKQYVFSIAYCLFLSVNASFWNSDVSWKTDAAPEYIIRVYTLSTNNKVMN